MIEKTNQEKRKKWDKTYREKHPEKVKDSQEIYSNSEHGKIKKKRWRDENPKKILESNRKYTENNREKINKKWRKYYNTIKGRLKTLRSHDYRRLHIKESELTLDILIMIDERDKVCVYCDKDFNNDIEHDHINPFLPFSSVNIVKCCRRCNRGKSNSDMIQWMNFKGYKISKKLLDLYKKVYS